MKNCCTNSQNEAGFRHNLNECAEGVSGSREDSVGDYAADAVLRTAEGETKENQKRAARRDAT